MPARGTNAFLRSTSSRVGAGELTVDYRFAKERRLLVSREYNAVFSNPGFRVSGRYLLLLAKASDLPRSRLGLVISKKNVGNAVCRNRIKRLCREAFRLHPGNFARIDIVVLARPGISKLDNATILATMQEQLDRLASQQARQATSAPRDRN